MGEKTLQPQLVKYKRKIIWAKVHVPVLSFLLSEPDVVIMKIRFQTVGSLVYFSFVYLPSPSSCMLCGWETVKHCMISYCCLASGFSESTSSGGLLSIRQLNVWLFLRPGSCGHGTPLTGQEEYTHTDQQGKTQGGFFFKKGFTVYSLPHTKQMNVEPIQLLQWQRFLFCQERGEWLFESTVPHLQSAFV